MPETRIDQAIRFATLAHGGQSRKGTAVPYITHPFAVAMLLAQAGCGEEEIIAGLLHDTVEDAGISYTEITRAFGPTVAALVRGCSEPDHGAPWEERKAHTVTYLRQASAAVKRVACADKLHNLRQLAADHAVQGEAVWQSFKRGREAQAWYYRGLAEAFGPERAAGLCPQLFSAFGDEVDAFFGPPA